MSSNFSEPPIKPFMTSSRHSVSTKSVVFVSSSDPMMSIMISTVEDRRIDVRDWVTNRLKSPEMME